MTNTDEIIEKLWHEKKAFITTPDGEEFRGEFTNHAGFLDIVLSSESEPVGFITLKHEGKGTYSIVNDTKINPHPTFVNTPGHGLEVKKKYRKRSIGAALLSIGIGIAQRDFKTYWQDGIFKVVASDITHLGLGCYQHFGFQVRQGMLVSAGHYFNLECVPEINITKKKATRLTRLKKRLGFA